MSIVTLRIYENTVQRSDGYTKQLLKEQDKKKSRVRLAQKLKSAKAQSETKMSEAKKTADKKATITKLNIEANVKTDFSETLEITRTLFKNTISKTSIVESALVCASAQSKAFTCTQIAKFITTNLNVKDCFHKRE